MRSLTIERVPMGEVDWCTLDALDDRLVFHRREWLNFLARTQRAEPVVAVLRAGQEVHGWFTGLVTKRWGVRILGAPLPGWATQYLGFNLLPGADRAAAYSALVPFAFQELRCAHVEVCDRGTVLADLAGLGGRYTIAPTMTVDLQPDESEILARMTSGTRQNLRKGNRVGLVVEDATPNGFAAEYYSQLRDVFAKQRLVPAYGQDRVEALIEAMEPTGCLQLIRVRAPDGTSIATAILIGMGRSVYFWGGASWREHQRLRPNETLFWHAFRTWKARGAVEFDFGGGGEYKRKYGATDLLVPHARWSRWAALEPLRTTARRAVAARQHVAGLAARRGQPPEPRPEKGRRRDPLGAAPSPGETVAQ